MTDTPLDPNTAQGVYFVNYLNNVQDQLASGALTPGSDQYAATQNYLAAQGLSIPTAPSTAASSLAVTPPQGASAVSGPSANPAPASYTTVPPPAGTDPGSTLNYVVPMTAAASTAVPAATGANAAYNTQENSAQAAQTAYFNSYVADVQSRLASGALQPGTDQYAATQRYLAAQGIPMPTAAPSAASQNAAFDAQEASAKTAQDAYAVQQPLKTGAAVSPTSTTPAATTDPSQMVGGVALPYGVPQTAPLPAGVSEPQLMPASGQYSTPYYQATTNNGLFAGAVMASPDQQIRLVDPNTGDVVYQGTGPDAARIATATANSISQNDGKKAAWQIQGANPDGTWTTQAEDLVDTNHNLLGTLASIALPILGAIFLPGIGAALGASLGIGGSAAALTTGATGILGSAAGTALGAGLGAATGSATAGVLNGEPIGQIALGAGLAGLGAGVVGPAIGNAVSSLGSAAGSTGDLIGSVGNDTLGALPGTVSDVIVNGATNSGLAGALGAGAGAAAGAATTPPSTNTVSPVTVTAATPSSVPAALGAGAGVLAGNEISPVTVTPQVTSPATQATNAAGGDLGTLLDPVTVTPPKVTASQIDSAAGAAAPALLAALASGDPSQVAQWAKDNPLKVAAVVPLIASLLGGGSSTGTTTGGVGNNGNAGTPGSLDSVFTAGLPPSTLSSGTNRNGLTPTVADWTRYAIDNPEQNFFSGEKAAAPATFAVKSPSQIQLQGIGDLNGDGVIDAKDLAIFKARFAGKGYAKGGAARNDFAVTGAGDGRSDSIPAKLSDGEYVIDAETVSLLGNGSSKAGAKKLDQFRVNIRKAKGKALAKGRFSANAKDPQDYCVGGRI